MLVWFILYWNTDLPMVHGYAPAFIIFCAHRVREGQTHEPFVLLWLLCVMLILADPETPPQYGDEILRALVEEHSHLPDTEFEGVLSRVWQTFFNAMDVVTPAPIVFRWPSLDFLRALRDTAFPDRYTLALRYTVLLFDIDSPSDLLWWLHGAEEVYNVPGRTPIECAAECVTDVMIRYASDQPLIDTTASLPQSIPQTQ